MRDPRTDKLADLLVDYSVDVQPQEKVLIQGELGAEPLLAAVYRKCLAKGAYPFVIPYTEDWVVSILSHAKPEQFEGIYAQYKQMCETYDTRIRILGELNTKELSQFDPELVASFYNVIGDAIKIVLDRAAKGKMKWVAALFPTQAYAQDANMSLAEYENFVYDACMPDPDDPVGYWKKVHDHQEKIIAWLKGKKQVHITAPGTDLALSIEGRPFINCDCKENVPDGEVFTSPVENSANGYVNFTYPTLYEGFEVTNVRLEFKDGKVVNASADKNQDFLLSKLDADPGARYLGEFAIGTNEKIDRFTGQILFDEKIGGSFHLAMGHGYPESLAQNDSSIHWDMVCDLRKGGAIIVDGELFYQDGKFAVDF